jgi:DNA-binding FrmR family transcriptional regulator
MIPRDLSDDILTRLKSIAGQVNGLVKLLENGGDPEKIAMQFKATRSALDKAHFLLLDETYRKTLAMKISEVVHACPGDCGYEDRIEFIRQEFPSLELDSLTEKLKEIDVLKTKLNRPTDD